jgi:hypothetical protein
MSRQFRYRVTALVLGGLLLGGPLVASGTASAEQVRPEQEQAGQSGHQVTFDGGGVLGRSCHSRPDIESMTVPAASLVRVVNRTGYSANLQLGGDAKSMLPDRESIEVVFRRGTTAMTLRPHCALGNDAKPALVTAQPSTPATTTPRPTPGPTVGDLSTLTGNVTGSSDPSDSVVPDPLAAPAHSHRVTSADGRPATARAISPHSAAIGQPATADAPGSVKARPKTKVKRGLGTAGSVEPSPLGTKNALAPGVPEPDLDLAPSGVGPAAVSAPTTGIAAAEPVAAMEPLGEQVPTGLLAVIATVFALGVGFAAIRAFVSQRANRAGMA